MLQNATPLRKWAPWPPNISHTENASLQILFKSPMSAIVFGIATKPSRFAHFRQDRQSLAPATRNDISTSKSGPNPWCFLYILIWKRDSRHNGVHFFDISTSKSGPNPWCFLYILIWKRDSRHNGVHFFDISTSKSGPGMVCFVHFDLETRFAPQRRALFRHLNFQKWSDNGVFCTCWLRNVLRATTACNFSSLIWPAGSAPAALASLLFDPPEPQIIGKTMCFATFLPFRASASSFFWLFLFYSSSLLIFSLLSASALLCFSSVHIVGSLTSKLPSITIFKSHGFCRTQPPPAPKNQATSVTTSTRCRARTFWDFKAGQWRSQNSTREAK